MKKILALIMALVLVLSLGACGKAPAAETKAPTEADVSVTEKATETEAARPHFDKLTLEFVPSKDADVIIAGTENLPGICGMAAAMKYSCEHIDENMPRVAAMRDRLIEGLSKIPHSAVNGEIWVAAAVKRSINAKIPASVRSFYRYGTVFNGKIAVKRRFRRIGRL